MIDTLISICIPTYNRAKYLKEALDSICDNLEADPSHKKLVEVIISDNHSADDTQAVVEVYRDQLPIIYHRNNRNEGAVANLFKTASLAHGTYVWFLSDDDVLTPGALRYLVEFLRYNQDIQYVYYSRLIADKDLNHNNIVQPAGLTSDAIFNNGKELAIVFQYAVGIMGYYSSTIIRRTLWIENNSSYIRDCHELSHLELIFQSICEKKCAIIAKPGVVCREGNSRAYNVNSLVWFDGFLKALLYAKDLGYDPATIDPAVASVSKSGQRIFFIDKMLGKRAGNFKSVFIGLGGDIQTLDKTLWYWASYLPSTLLGILKPIYRAKASVYRMESN